MKTLLTILLIGYTTFSFSQTDFFTERDADLELGINTKYHLNTAEIGLHLYREFKELSKQSWNSDAIILGSEFGIKNNSFLYVPKITYSYNYILVNGSLSLLNYNYSDNHSVYIRPQLGVTALGYLDIVYGYNIPLSKHNQEFQGSTVTLRMKFETISILF
jgi:hypothetical protein